MRCPAVGATWPPPPPARCDMCHWMCGSVSSGRSSYHSGATGFAAYSEKRCRLSTAAISVYLSTTSGSTDDRTSLCLIDGVSLSSIERSMSSRAPSSAETSPSSIDLRSTSASTRRRRSMYVRWRWRSLSSLRVLPCCTAARYRDTISRTTPTRVTSHRRSRFAAAISMSSHTTPGDGSSNKSYCGKIGGGRFGQQHDSQLDDCFFSCAATCCRSCS
mmetsp:Transcript_23916/g.74105  ORF Transcript_23916/g.74105 Transcript_23916/m.74105 type:complete len:217 (-) Transcript_23916:2820-3470(-)